MPKRKPRPTLPTATRKRLRAKGNLVQGLSSDGSTPSDNEWSLMIPHDAFILRDDEGGEHTFRIGSYAIIQPHGRAITECLEIHEYWVGKIVDIRSRNRISSEVWTRVKWLYSGPDIAIEKKTFDRVACARMERFSSKAYDYVHSSCYQDVVNCISYDESDVEPSYISEDDFFRRHSYNHLTKKIDPAQKGTCLCRKPYNPDTTSLMAFCPRFSCQKAYDYSCLEKAGAIDESDHQLDRAPRHIQLERSLPHVSVRETREPVTYTVKGDDEGKGAPDGSYDGIPSPLVELARSPMAKGKMLHAGGVVGNIAFVYRARQIVQSILKDGKPPPEDLEVALGLGDLDVEELIVKDKSLICPECGGAI